MSCEVCPRNCVVAPGGLGICKARQNIDGKFYTLIYSLCSSIAADPIEKKPVFHFCPGSIVLSLGTLGCNLRCKHCQNWQIAHADALKDGKNLEVLEPLQLIELARKTSSKGVAWTYNEPTIWLEYILEGAKLCKENGLYTVAVTNGYITEKALDLIGPYLDVFRVDIKGFTSEAYFKIAKVKDFTHILIATKRAKFKWNCHVEVVTNVIPTINDDAEQLRGIATWIVNELGPETPWHVTRFMPYLEFSHLPPTPLDKIVEARDIGLASGLKFVYVGNVPGNEGENTICPNCGQVAVRRRGFYVSSYKVKSGKCANCGEDLNIKDSC
ncbi:MAG: AmmeMemoRadiSam system radical SAM enzyme [Actinobacteria bacterium]|nr:AmmeMemoRadiSam system radical SAM enzyme [Actinomycetota bacterium]